VFIELVEIKCDSGSNTVIKFRLPITSLKSNDYSRITWHILLSLLLKEWGEGKKAIHSDWYSILKNVSVAGRGKQYLSLPQLNWIWEEYLWKLESGNHRSCGNKVWSGIQNRYQAVEGASLCYGAEPLFMPKATTSQDLILKQKMAKRDSIGLSSKCLIGI